MNSVYIVAGLVLALLAAFSVLSAYAERPVMPVLSKWVPSTEGKPIQDFLHGGLLALYGLLAMMGAIPLALTSCSAWVLFWYIAAVFCLRAALFESILANGKPGRVWGMYGTSSTYDKLRGHIALAWGLPRQTVGSWSNWLAIGASAASILGLFMTL